MFAGQWADGGILSGEVILPLCCPYVARLALLSCPMDGADKSCHRSRGESVLRHLAVGSTKQNTVVLSLCVYGRTPPVYGRHTTSTMVDSTMRYTPLFDLTDSSIWEEPYHVRILFITMLARKLPDQVVYADEYKLKKWSNLATIDEVYDALKVLESPDNRRPKQAFDGRRIERVDGGWLVLNGMKYEEMMQKVNERARKARWARENRERQRSNGKLLEKGLKDLNDEVDTGYISETSDPAF